MSAFDLTPYLGLFKIGWQSDLSQLPHPRGADHLTIETAAWLAEINEQLTNTAQFAAAGEDEGAGEQRSAPVRR